MSRGFALLVALLAVASVAGTLHAATPAQAPSARPAAASDGRTLVDRLLTGTGNRFGGLADIPDNQRFFDHKVTASNLDAIRAVAGQKAVKELGLEEQTGKSIRDFVQDNREALSKSPWVLTALTRDVNVNATTPVILDESGRTANLADPARTIGAKDVFEQAQGPDASPRALRRFLQDNFGLENKSEREQPDQIYAFSVFMNFLSGRNRNDLKAGRDAGQDGMNDANQPSDQVDYLEDNFVRDAGASASTDGPPAATQKGLFLPSNEALDRMKNLLKLYREINAAREAGRDPTASTDFAGKDLASWLQELDVGRPPYDVRAMSAAELKRAVMAMMDKLVKREIERDNDYVFEQSSSATATADGAGGATPGDGTPAATTLRPSFVVGNAKASKAMNDAYQRLLQPLTETQRTEEEIRQGGGFQFRVPVNDLTGGEAPGPGTTKKTYDIVTPDAAEGGLTLSPQQPTDK